MDRFYKQRFIRHKAAERKIRWSRHALSRLASMPISVRELESALQSGEVIEDYPHLHRYLPDCLVLAFITGDTPVHCVVALNEVQDYILIVTVYLPSEKEWQNDWRTRKRAG